MRRVLLILTCLAFIGGSAYVVLREHRSRTRQEPIELVAEVATSKPCLWIAGEDQQSRYTLSWQSEQKQLLTPTPGGDQAQAWMNSSSSLSGKLITQGLGEERCAAWVWLEQLEQASMKVEDAEMLTEPGAVERVQALAHWSRAGELQSVGFTEGTSTSTQNLLTALLTELQVVLPDPGELQTNRGLATTQSQQTDAGWLRSKLRYSGLRGLARPAQSQQLQAQASFSLDDDGRLVKLSDAEQLQAHDHEGGVLLSFTQSLQLERVAQQPASAPPAAQLAVRRQPGQPIVDETNRRAELEQRAAKLSGTQMLAQVRSYRGELTRPGDFMWQGTARLQLEPELNSQLAETLSSAVATRSARELGLDLLAHAGHAEAQAAMRQVLSSPAVREDATGFIAQVQRFAFVKNPDAETVAFLRQQIESGGAPGPGARIAATFALGSVAGHLRDRGKRQQARALVGLLNRQLTSASTPEDQKACIAALGNAHDPDSLETLLDFAETGQAVLRSEAATALRHYRQPAVTEKLVKLAGDSSSLVQRSALSTLRDRPLGETELTRLHGHVRDQRSASLNDAMLVGLLAPYTHHDIVRHTLGLVLQRSVGDAKLRARIRNMLRG